MRVTDRAINRCECSDSLPAGLRGLQQGGGCYVHVPTKPSSPSSIAGVPSRIQLARCPIGREVQWARAQTKDERSRTGWNVIQLIGRAAAYLTLECRPARQARRQNGCRVTKTPFVSDSVHDRELEERFCDARGQGGGDEASRWSVSFASARAWPLNHLGLDVFALV